MACIWLQSGLPTREGRKPVEKLATVQSFISLLEGGKRGAVEIERIARVLIAQGFGGEWSAEC